MKRLLIAAALTATLLIPAPARAATEWVVIFTTFNPYSTQVVAGPFDSQDECYAILRQESYISGGSYSCRMINA